MIFQDCVALRKQFIYCCLSQPGRKIEAANALASSACACDTCDFTRFILWCLWISKFGHVDLDLSD